ncbi:putative serine hydrolase [Saccharomycopsis crataegensis]|uniref:Serine hydrolase n=1 Tax=Saccharomycopsis crataegensis TaxID=43959 RepID=A0AAV5QH42_9ASCO|nr:putative serine hydrolase [Saccharomycopsis crataegensis]
MSSSPNKILMLHGFAQNASIFRAKTSRLRKLLEGKSLELYYADAPIELKPEDNGSEVISAIKLRAWWITECQNGQKSFDITQAITSIKEIIIKEGPFVGIIGFSQGAALAQMIVNNINEWGNGDTTLKFSIFVSGFAMKESMVDKHQEVLNNKISLPSMMVIGELDTVISNERSLEFVKNNTEPGTNIVVSHQGAHIFPSSNTMMKKISEWISTFC